LETMLKNQRGNSIIEVMVVIVILTIGIVGTYGILNSGQKISIGAENRLKAINIAREWIEAVENIRDSNWIKFSNDYDNCWKVKNYDPLCIGDTSGNRNFSTGSYLLVQSGTLWTLSGTITPNSAYNLYKEQFPIFLDSNGFAVSSGNNTPCTSSVTSNCKTIFTREIQIRNPDSNHLKINSIVQWVDNSKTSKPYILNLETTLTNWKKNF